MALDLDLDVGVDAAGDGMGAVRVEDAPAARAGVQVVEPPVQLAQRSHRQVDELDSRCLGRRRGRQTFVRSHA